MEPSMTASNEKRVHLEHYFVRTVLFKMESAIIEPGHSLESFGITQTLFNNEFYT
jgi:hypothetical protein